MILVREMIFNLVPPEGDLTDQCRPLDGQVLTAAAVSPTRSAQAVKRKKREF
jgi:hypothetical protein